MKDCYLDKKYFVKPCLVNEFSNLLFVVGYFVESGGLSVERIPMEKGRPHR